jgi:ABC-type sugar transport system substrate-binding protein
MLWAAVATASLVALTACSGGTEADGTGANGSNGGRPAVVTDAMNPVTQAKTPTEPFTPPTGKHILVMTCGSAGQGCVNEAEEEKRVGESLGWTVDVIDGKLDPTVWNQTVKQAADSGVDGIISISADPNLMTEAMETVVAKDIPFVLTEQAPGNNDVKGIDTYIAPDPAVGGADVAKWMIADSGGKANVLLLDFPGYTNVQQRTAAIAKGIERDCADCTVKKVDVPVQTMGTTLTPQVSSELQQNPDIDYIWGSDDCCVSFMQQAIQQTGKTNTVKLVSMTGFPEQMAQLKTGQMSGELASPTQYTAWLAIDSLGRLMAGKPTEKFWPLPQRIWTQDSIKEAPPEVFKDGWNLDFDYRAKFKELWGR